MSYFYSTFTVILLLKEFYINAFAHELVFAGYIKSVTLFSFSYRNWILFTIALISLFFLCYVRSKIDSPYKYTVIAYITFNILGVYVIATDLFEILSLIIFLLYGGLVSIVMGLRILSYKPDWLSNKDIDRALKIELVKIRISNWWRGLTILTSIIIALFVTALVSWVLAPTPEDLKLFEDFAVKLSFYLFIMALPGLMYFYIRILKQINYLENCLMFID